MAAVNGEPDVRQSAPRDALVLRRRKSGLDRLRRVGPGTENTSHTPRAADFPINLQMFPSSVCSSFTKN